MTQDSEFRRPSIDRRLLDGLVSIASQAAAAILAVSPADLARRDKVDQSPVTAADEASEVVILQGLSRLLPGTPVVSEESFARVALPVRTDTFLLVDPLDGTRELIAGMTEYTVNVALIDDGAPVAGVIAAPAFGTIWAGAVGQGAERLALAAGAEPAAARERVAIRTRPRPQRGAIAPISRFHRDAATDACLDRIPGLERVVWGSSIKFCRIAEGAADIYVRLTSLSEWDVAAGHALVVAAGGAMTALDGAPLRYGSADLRLPSFVASGDRTAPLPGWSG